MKYSVGIGITNRCNYQCGHCYSRKYGFKGSNLSSDLSFDDIKRICKTLNIEAINFGTGESVLHPQFINIIGYCHEHGIKMGLTTNGLTVKRLDNTKLKIFNDIDFSLDFPDRKRHNDFRGENAYENVIEGIERCKDVRVECSIVICMMNTNYMVMNDLVSLASDMNVNLRVNIYKPIHTELFALSYTQFWEGIKLLLKNSRLVSCSEPIVNVALKMSGIEPKSKGNRCGKNSFRIHPDRTVRPCVYWPYGNKTIDDIGKKDFLNCDVITIIPVTCVDCRYIELCQGGCPSRRLFRDINKPDEFCPVLRNDDLRLLDVRFSKSKSLVHSEYLCTIIVEGYGN